MSEINEIKKFYKGQTVKLTGRFFNNKEQPVDPTTVLFKLRSPSGVITSYVHGTDAELFQDLVGVYHVDVDVNESGTWFYRFYTTDAVKGAAETEFVVRRSQF